MKSDDNVLNNVKKWLRTSGHSQVWLAKKMGIDPSLLSRIFSGKRRLQPIYKEKISVITEQSITDLSTSLESQKKSSVYSLRGEVSTEEGTRALAQLLLDAEHYVHLLVK